MKHTHIRNVALLGFTLLAGAAHAHTGHGTSGLMEGLAHPFGLDHLLAMVAVGIWSVKALPSGQAGRGPATFLLALLVGAALGAAGVVAPYLEHAISLSVVLFGLMLVFAHRAWPTVQGLGLIAAAAVLHGLAHGAETPAIGFAGYAVGFMLTTTALHLSGLGVGLAIQRWMGQRSGLALGGLGVSMGAAGLYLFAQLT
jgi:urease accessory protein